MRVRTLVGASAVTLVALLAFASTAMADSAVFTAVAEAPMARFGLAVASVIFTAALARTHT